MSLRLASMIVYFLVMNSKSCNVTDCRSVPSACAVGARDTEQHAYYGDIRKL